MEQVMRCKMSLNECNIVPSYNGKATTTKSGSMIPDGRSVKIKFGVVWEGSQDNQKKSENAIFGENTPMGSFEAVIMNPILVQKLPGLVGKQFYVDFTVIGDEVFDESSN